MRSGMRVLSLSGWPERSRSLRLGLPSHEDAVAFAREAVGRWVSGLAATQDEAFDVRVAVSEACSNAVEHPVRRRLQLIQLEADRDGPAVRLSVRDFGRWDESPSSKERGRGLGLMSRLMNEVEIERGRDGTRVILLCRLQAANQPAAEKGA